jgi:hypothetical protein
MDSEEMIKILEELIRDPETNPTARCTAIRTLREIEPDPPPASDFTDLYKLAPKPRPKSPKLK